MLDISISFLKPHSLLAAASVLWIAQSAAADDDHRSVRVTTGTVEIQGWENSLLKGNDPNLKRWHWHPIYGTVQGNQPLSKPRNAGGGHPGPTNGAGNRQPTSASANQPPMHRSSYTKPIHVPFVPHYQAPPPMPDVSQVRGNQTNQTHNDVNANLSNKDANGSLQQKKTDASLLNKNVAGEAVPKAPPAVATYGDYGATASGATTQVQRADVYGVVKKHKKQKTLNF